MPRRLVGFLLAASSLTGCPDDAGFLGPGAGGGPGGGDDPYYCCDPDEAPCLCEGYWHCTEGALGKTCRQTNPGLPDDGGAGPWTCEYRDETIVCSGRQDEHPDAGQDGGWSCASQGELIECSKSTGDGDYPTGEGEGPWDCSYSPGGGLRACTESTGSGGNDWDCSVSMDGSTVCVNENPDQPDGGQWDCSQAGGRDVCESDHFPADGGDAGWSCIQNGELVRCESDAAQEPDGGGDAPWNCYWGEGGSELTCIQRGNLDGGDVGNGGGNDGGGGGNPGGEGGDGSGGGGGDGNGEGDDGGGQDCACPPDAWRYCDTPMYCSWGIQECQEIDGKSRWGLCLEDDRIPGACWNGEMFDAEAEQCALDEGFCVQDFWDLDRDGDSNETLGDDCPEVGQCIDGGDAWGGWF